MSVRNDLPQRRQQDLRSQWALAAALFVGGVALSGISLFRIASEGARMAELSASSSGPPSTVQVPTDKTAPSAIVK